MKKKNVLNLIKYYTEGNDRSFRNEAYEIARDFDESGDTQLSHYIMGLLSDANTFIPQTFEDDHVFLDKVDRNDNNLWIPEAIMDDLLGIVNAVSNNVDINKFLFEGAPGTGKTEAAIKIAKILNRTLYMVNFEEIIDSKLGQTQKNISELFTSINSFYHPETIIILFDEIDALALDRTNSNDIREMGRATSALLKGFDHLDEKLLIIATTNLIDYFDKALLRRFDAVINFNRYSRDDLKEIAMNFLNKYLSKFKLTSRDLRLFKKIIDLAHDIPYPADLDNIIKTSIAFSNPKDDFDYMRRLYIAICGCYPDDIEKLKLQGFTLREIEILTKIPKSTVARELKRW